MKIWELLKQSPLIVKAIMAGVLLLAVLSFLFIPLIHNFKLSRQLCRAVEEELEASRERVALFNIGGKRTLVDESELSLAIEELTRQGKLSGVNFLSITPRGIRSEKTGFKILPIELELESSYDKLGEFLGVLGELQNSLAVVESFNIEQTSQGPLNLRTKITVNLYFLG